MMKTRYFSSHVLYPFPFRSIVSIVFISILALIFAAPAARAIQTGEVEIGVDGAYDGAVRITRDGAGRLVFSDAEVPDPVSLFTLYSSGNDHGLLAGLADDDHPQYATDADLASNAAVDLDGAGAAGRLALWSDADTLGATAHLSETASGVGVGTATPSVKLHVKGSGDAMRLEGPLAGLGNLFMTFYDSAGTRLGYLGYPSGSSNIMALWQQAAGDIQIGAANSERLRITASGNVGIGAAVPAQKLDVNGGAVVRGALVAGASGEGRLVLNGQLLPPGPNLLDNPDFTIWQRGTAQSLDQGGDAGGTLTHPVPGAQTLAADRWQASRAGTAMTAGLTRAAPPAGLSTARWALRVEATAGSPCRYYIHQALERDRTVALRGRWVTFAISQHLSSAAGGNIAIYKTVGGTVTELSRYNYSSGANQWERLAVAAQVPADAETLLVSIQPELSASGGAAVAHLANAALVAGRCVGASGERVTDLASSSVPPAPRDPAADLAACQRYFERGAFGFGGYSPGSTTVTFMTTARFQTTKAGIVTVTVSNLSASPLSVTASAAVPMPAPADGERWTAGFRYSISGSTVAAANLTIAADWTASCPEPN
jgi:hypothetical protein